MCFDLAEIFIHSTLTASGFDLMTLSSAFGSLRGSYLLAMFNELGVEVKEATAICYLTSVKASSIL